MNRLNKNNYNDSGKKKKKRIIIMIFIYIEYSENDLFKLTLIKLFMQKIIRENSEIKCIRDEN